MSWNLDNKLFLKYDSPNYFNIRRIKCHNRRINFIFAGLIIITAELFYDSPNRNLSN